MSGLLWTESRVEAFDKCQQESLAGLLPSVPSFCHAAAVLLHPPYSNGADAFNLMAKCLQDQD